MRGPPGAGPGPAARLVALALALAPPASARGAPLAPDDEPARPPTHPLVLLVQGEASGSALRLRRMRAGEDVGGGGLRARVVLEARGGGPAWTSLDGGRIAGGGPVRLTDAFLSFIPDRVFEIDLGAQRVPFSLSRQVDEADLRLPERPQILLDATPDFRTGLAVAGDLGLLQYRGALMSADTGVGRDLFASGTLLAFRLSADPIGPMGLTPWLRRADDPWAAWWRFSAGASILTGTLVEPHTLGVGGDAQLQWRRLTVTAEYVFLDAPAPAGARAGGPGTGRRQGAVVEPGVALLPERLELVVRAAWSRLAPAETLAAGAGLTLYTHAGRLRWQAAFESRRTTGDGAHPEGSWAIARATLAL